MNKKGFIIVGILILLIVLAVICSKFISDKKAEDKDYELFQVSEYLYFPLEVDGKYGVIKRDGSIVIMAEYDDVEIPNQDKAIFVCSKDGKHIVLNDKKEQLFENYEDVSVVKDNTSSENNVFNNTVLKYKENNRYGVLDFSGNKITDADYEEVSSLHSKYGEILVKKDGKYGVINIKGVTLVKCDYDYVDGDGYSKGGSYKNGGYIIGNKTKSGFVYGYIDKNQKEVLKMDQETLYRVTEINSEDVYLIASQNGRFALYRNKENITGYKYIDIFYNNGTDTFTVQKNKSYGLMKLDGNVVIPEEYNELMVVGIFVKASKNDVDYTFDLDGKSIENSQFVSLEKTVTGKLYISIDADYKYGVTDKDKNVLIENKYDYIEELEETGLLIATEGKNITIYSAGGNEIVSVENATLKMVDKYIQVSTANDLYYLTVDGKKVDNKTVYYENNIYAAKSGKKWGFVDARNNAIVPYQYDEVTELDEYGFAGINKNGKWGVINSNGDIILEPTYESDEISPVFIGKYCLKDGVVRDSI